MNLSIGSTRLTYRTCFDLDIILLTVIMISSENSILNLAPNEPKCSLYVIYDGSQGFGLVMLLESEIPPGILEDTFTDKSGVSKLSVAKYSSSYKTTSDWIFTISWTL